MKDYKANLPQRSMLIFIAKDAHIFVSYCITVNDMKMNVDFDIFIKKTGCKINQ